MAPVAALVCFLLDLLLELFGVVSPVNLVVLGLAFIALAMIIGTWPIGIGTGWRNRNP